MSFQTLEMQEVGVSVQFENQKMVRNSSQVCLSGEV